MNAADVRELARLHPQTVRLVSDREPVAWVSVLLEAFDESAFADLIEEAWKLRAPDDLVKEYAAATH